MPRIIIVNICAENNAPLELGFLSDYNPDAIERFREILKGQNIICSEESRDTLEGMLNGSAIINTVVSSSAQDEERDTYVLGEGRFTSQFSSEATHILTIKVHDESITGNSCCCCSSTPRIEGWTEVSRELIWGKTDGSKPKNCSIITLRKDDDKFIRPKISVIISAYNQTEWLRKVLWGYMAQEFNDFEMIIADDGSTKVIYDLLEEFKDAFRYPIKHIWIEDDGFRKCIVLNKAIEASAADYILFSDGDCIPRFDFTNIHFREREENRFLSNGYYKLPMAISKSISKDDIYSKQCFNLKWLRQQGIHIAFRNNKLTTTTGFKRWFLNTFTTAGATWNGHGASGWLTDILNANGFDERMRYGGEDRELGERLSNTGIRGKQIRYSTVCLHLDHARGYVSDEDIRRNKKIRKLTRWRRLKRTKYGIVKNTDQN